MSYPGIFKIHKDEILVGALLVIVTLSLPISYLPFLPALVILISLVLMYKEKFVLSYTIVTFLTVSTNLSPTIRTLVQITNILLLGFYFLKNYGFNFREYPAVPRSLALFFLSLFGVMILSSFNSNLFLGLEQVLRLIVFLVVVYFTYSLVILQSKNWIIVLKAFYLVSLVYAGYLLYEFSKANFNIIQYNISQVTSLGNEYLPKNLMGSFFSIVLTITFSFLFFFKEPGKKYFLLFIIFISSISLVLLNARTSIFTAIIGFIFICYYFRKNFIKWIIAGLPLLALLLLIEPVYDLFEIYFRLERISAGRDYILSAALNVIKENWLLGAGPAGTKFELYKDLPFMLNSPIEKFISFHYSEIEFGHAHNFYLFFFSDLGIAGFILSLMLPVLFFYYGNSVVKKLDRSSFEYHAVIAVLGCGFCMFIRGLFEWGGLISYGTLNSDLPFWLLFAFLIYFYQTKKEKTS